MNVIVDVGGRAAIPVRAIPILSNWETMSPDVVAMSLAWDEHFHEFHGLRAYHVDNGSVGGEIDATWWENYPCRKLKALSEQIRATELSHEVGYDEWRSKSLPLLPAGVFVWKDEFEGRYYQKYGAEGTTFLLQGVGGKMPSEEQARRVKLNFAPFVYDVDLSRCVMQGFESFERSGRVKSAESLDSTFEPLFPLLATHWDVSFEMLPSDLKTRVRQYFPLIGWDVGNPTWRQKCVAEKDFEDDPSMADERARLWTISSRIDDIKREIREWVLSSVPTANDRQVRDEKIRALRCELVEKRIAISAPVSAAGILVQDPPDSPLSLMAVTNPVRSAPRQGDPHQLRILLPAGTEEIPVPDVPTLIAVAKYRRMVEAGLLPERAGGMPEDEMARLRNVQIYKLEREHNLELMQALSLGIRGKPGGLPAYSNLDGRRCESIDGAVDCYVSIRDFKEYLATTFHGRFTLLVEGDLPQEATQTLPVAPGIDKAIPGWNLRKPVRYQGYGRPLYNLLKTAHLAGRARPTARDVLDAWKLEMPPEVFEVMHDELKYYGADGQSNTATLAAIGKAIIRLTK